MDNSQVITYGIWNVGKIPCQVQKQRNSFKMKINDYISKRFYFTHGMEHLALYEAYMWGMEYVLKYNYFINNYRYIYDATGKPLHIEMDLNNGFIMKCEIEDMTNISSYVWYYKDGKAYTKSSIDNTFSEVSFLEMKYPHHVDQFDFGFFNGDQLDYRYENIHLVLNTEYITKLRDYFSHPTMVDVGIQKSVKKQHEAIQTVTISSNKKDYFDVDTQTEHVNISKRNLRRNPIVKKQKPKLTETGSIMIFSIEPEKKITMYQKLQKGYNKFKHKCYRVFKRNTPQIIIIFHGVIGLFVMFYMLYYISNYQYKHQL